MAQAPQGGGGGGAPRQNKTVKEFKGMNTQNQRNAITEGQFGWLENIQPIGPGHLHSIPGRSTAVVEIPPPGNCAPGQQSMMQYERRFAENRTEILRVSWAYISPTEELYKWSAGANDGCENYDGVLQLLEHFIGPYPLGNPPIGTVTKVPRGAIPDFCTANACPGHADEPMTGSASNGGMILIRINSQTMIDITYALNDTDPLGIRIWAKEGAELFVIGDVNGNNVFNFGKFNMAGATIQRSTGINALQPNDICLTAGFVYVLITDTSPPVHQYILKFARSDIATVVDTIELNDISANLIFALSDELIFIGAMAEATFDAQSHRLYYWDGQERWVGVATPLNLSDPSSGLSPFTPQTSHVLTFGSGLSESRYFYWGNNGFAGAECDVWRMGPMLCTVPPLHPSVSGPATGTIGGSVDIVWSGILEPSGSFSPPLELDYIVLLPAADVFSMAAENHTTVERQPTDGNAGGTLTFTIPGTMVAGSYRIWLGGRDRNILLAKGGLITLS